MRLMSRLVKQVESDSKDRETGGLRRMLSVSEAVKEAKVSRATIWRAIKEGRLSSTKTETGEVRLDPAELFRVFEPRERPVKMASRTLSPPPLPVSPTETESETLRQVISSHETTIKVQDEALKDLRNRLETTERRLDESERERRQMTQTLTGLLTHQGSDSKTENSSSSFIWWVLGTTLVIAIGVGAFIFRTSGLPKGLELPSGVSQPLSTPDKPSGAL